MLLTELSAAIQPVPEDAVSLAQLLQVKLPSESAGQTLVDLKPTAKPAEDFMAVLDRALADRGRNDDQSALPSGQAALPVENPQKISQAPAEKEAPAAKSNEAAAIGQKPESETMSTSPWMEKYHSRQTSAAKVETLQREAKQPANRVLANTAAVHAEKPQLKAAANLESLALANALINQALVQRHNGQAQGPEAPNDKTQANRKITHKTGLAQSAAEIKNQHEISLKTKPEPKDSQGRAAALQMQLHADTGGTKGLHDAMNMVRNLAKDLGIEQNGVEQAKAAARSLDLSRNQINTNNVIKMPGGDKKDRLENLAESRSARVDILRNERLGKHGPESALRQAADSGRVQVLDLRNASGSHSLVLDTMVGQSQGKLRSEDAGKGRDSLQLVNSAYIPAAERNTVSVPLYLNGSQAGNLHQALRQHLEKQGNGDIVQQAKIIMNGKDNGEIRLILKPESLGEVRIHLNMQEGHIAGQIFVENKDVQKAFEENMPALLQAFQDGGFDASSMQVAVGDHNGASGQGFNFQDQQPSDRQKLYAVGRLENSVATVKAVTQDYSQINLVV